MKVWITKYALTKGIFEAEVQRSDPDSDMVVDESGRYAQFYFGQGRDWHLSMDGAKAKAEEMRLAKIKSLQKQIANLEKLKF